jgi:adenine-specific DNA methylase
MNSFPVAPPPSSEKLRGGYYTPDSIADFLADWVRPAGSRLLEPSCGDGAILKALERLTDKALGIEIEAHEAGKARMGSPSAEVVNADFFDWFDERQHGAWSGVAGNPPFIRFQHWPDPMRSAAFEVMRSVDMKPSRLTNAWVPFVVASTLAVREGGRLGLVVPAELLQVTYAAELRAFLVDKFSELTAVTFKRLVFKGVLQEVVLLLGVRGPGPAKVRVVEIEDTASLPSPNELSELPHAPALVHDTEKWTKYFLPPTQIEALRRALRRADVLRLGDLADVDVGVVTGRNRFFVISPSNEEKLGLHEHLSTLVSKSAHLQGVRFADEDYERLVDSDALCRLLAVTNGHDPDEALAAYIEAGEQAGVHEGYKCSIRKHWWIVPSTWTPDAFLLRQIYDHPRIVANETGATSTDTVHRVRMLNGTPPIKLAAASINSMTFAFSEVLGRSYGGGVLELEPREAESLPVPDPKRLAMSDVKRIDRLMRQGELSAALDYADARLLVDFPPRLTSDLRRVWMRLRDRRLARGKGQRS